MKKSLIFIIPERIIELIDKSVNELIALDMCNLSSIVFVDDCYELILDQSSGEPDVISSRNETYDVTLLPVTTLYRGLGKDQRFDFEDLLMFKDDYEQKIKELIISAVKNKKHEKNIIIFDIFGFSHLSDLNDEDVVSQSVEMAYRIYHTQLSEKKLVFISPLITKRKMIIRLYINGKESIDRREVLDYWDNRFIYVE